MTGFEKGSGKTTFLNALLPLAREAGPAKGGADARGERIIRSELQVEGNKLLVRSKFTVPLADHNITIPHIVNQKIAEEVALTVEAVLK